MLDESKILTRPESHREVLKLLSTKPKGSILDIPAGRGSLSAEMRQMGFDVQACDIDGGNNILIVADKPNPGTDT